MDRTHSATGHGTVRSLAYFAATVTHFWVDVLNSSRNLLVALLAVSLGLTNEQVGITLLVYNFGSSLTQPLFGWLSDRFGPRWPVVGGLGWMILFFSLTAVSEGWPALIFITVAGVGSGAFHPSGTLVASQASKTNRARATAVFFMAGQFGIFVGPVLTGILLKQFGWMSYLSLPLISLGALLAEWLWVRPDHAPRPVENKPEPVTAVPMPPVSAARSKPSPLLLVSLFLVIISTNTVSIGMLTFVPKLFTELGYATDYVGWATGLYMAGSGIGGVVGGNLADRFGGKWIIVAGFSLAALPIWAYIPAGDPYRFMLLMLAGFFGGMPHSVLVLLAQSLLPRREGLASGIVLGLMFFSGAIGSYVLGLVADVIGLAVTMQGTAWLMVIGAAAAMTIPHRPARKDKGARSDPMSAT